MLPKILDKDPTLVKRWCLTLSSASTFSHTSAGQTSHSTTISSPLIRLCARNRAGARRAQTLQDSTLVSSLFKERRLAGIVVIWLFHKDSLSTSCSPWITWGVVEAAASSPEMPHVACECRIWETTGKYYSGGFCRVWEKGEHRWHCLCVGSGDGAFQRARNIGQ